MNRKFFFVFALYAASSFFCAGAAEPLAEASDAHRVEDLAHESDAHPTDENEKKALDINLLYIGDGVYGFTGPLDNQATKMENLLLNITMDGEKLYKVHGNSVFLSYIGTWGANPSAVLKSPQWIDNIENSYQTALLFQAWMEQRFISDRLSVLVGLYDFNSEFDVTDSALIFIMPPMGAPTEIGLSGVMGPSTYPVTSLAGRVKIMPNDEWYLMAAVFDGIPGNPNKLYGTHIDLIKSNGLLWFFENGVVFGTENKQYKFAVGGWFYTMTTDTLTGAIPAERNHGIYGTVDVPLYRFSDNSDRGVNFFLRPGIANSAVSSFSPTIGGGLYFKGPFSKRAKDEAGVAFSYAKSTQEYITVNTPTALTSETLVEATYALNISDYVVIQPSLEWVLPTNQNPEEPAEPYSMVGILRLKVTT